MNKNRIVTKMRYLLLLCIVFMAGCASNGGDPGTLVAITVTPAISSLPLTGTLQYSALAVFGDGSARDVTTSSTWSAGTTGVTFGSTSGLATGAIANATPVVITAKYNGTTGTAALTVNAATSRSFTVTPETAVQPITGTRQYTALETFSDGTTIDRTAVAIWSATDLVGNGVATILPGGLATAVAAGKATITARFNDKTAAAVFTVTPTTSVALTVTPKTANQPITGIRQYTALETFSDGTTIDRTAVAIWSTTDLVGTGVATILPSGLATAVAAGQATITARFNDKTATAILTVNPTTSVSFTVTPTTASIPISGHRPYTALETFSDGSTIDRTAVAAWTAPDLSGTGVAAILPSGVATGIAAGQATITAKFNGKTATAILTVNPTTSVSFTVTPATATLPITGTRPYTALETFSDGSTIDRTTVAAWTAPDLSGTGVAVILPSGVATAVAAGQAIITAKFNGKTATALLTVNPATVVASVSFTVTPATATLPITGTRPYTALETFSDGSTIDRTNVASWTAPDLTGFGVATIMPSGLATAVAAGQATITAKFNGKTATARLTVIPATVTSVSLAVTPATASILISGTRPYTVLETFSDGSTIDRTAVASWSAVDFSGTGVATILNATATGNAVGQSTITAIYSGKTATARLTVTASPIVPPPASHLGSVGTYGIMATSAITNTGATTKINGDVALEPGTSNGLLPAQVNGAIHINDTVSHQAFADLLVAYNYYKNLPPGVTISAGADLGALYPLGMPPGTYTSGTSMSINTRLILDGGGNANAVWVFQIGSSITTTTPLGTIELRNGANANNIFWVPTASATIGVGTTFYGTVIAGVSITGQTGAVINGRLLAGAIGAGTIALDTNTVNVP